MMILLTFLGSLAGAAIWNNLRLRIELAGYKARNAEMMVTVHSQDQQIETLKDVIRCWHSSER